MKILLTYLLTNCILFTYSQSIVDEKVQSIKGTVLVHAAHGSSDVTFKSFTYILIDTLPRKRLSRADYFSSDGVILLSRFYFSKYILKDSLESLYLPKEVKVIKRRKGLCGRKQVLFFEGYVRSYLINFSYYKDNIPWIPGYYKRKIPSDSYIKVYVY